MFFESRLKKGCKYTTSKTVFKKLANTGLSKAKREVLFFYKFMQSLDATGLLEELEFKHAKRIIKDGGKSPKKRKPLLVKDTFRSQCNKLINKGEVLIVVGLHIMLCSGRRRKDVSRISSEKVRQVNSTKFHITLPFDKQSDKEIKFYLDFSEILDSWSLFSAETLGRSFSICLEKSAFPFQSFAASSIGKLVGFRPHSLRAIKAISLTITGWIDNDILRFIGWRQVSSLELYRRLTRREILDLGDLDSIIEMINR